MTDEKPTPTRKPRAPKTAKSADQAPANSTRKPRAPKGDPATLEARLNAALKPRKPRAKKAAPAAPPEPPPAIADEPSPPTLRATDDPPAVPPAPEPHRSAETRHRAAMAALTAGTLVPHVGPNRRERRAARSRERAIRRAERSAAGRARMVANVPPRIGMSAVAATRDLRAVSL